MQGLHEKVLRAQELQSHAESRERWGSIYEDSVDCRRYTNSRRALDIRPMSRHFTKLNNIDVHDSHSSVYHEKAVATSPRVCPPSYRADSSDESDESEDDLNADPDAQYILIHPGDPYYKGPDSTVSYQTSSADYSSGSLPTPVSARHYLSPHVSQNSPKRCLYKAVRPAAHRENADHSISVGLYFAFDDELSDMVDAEATEFQLDKSVHPDYPPKSYTLPDVPVDLDDSHEDDM